MVTEAELTWSIRQVLGAPRAIHFAPAARLPLALPHRHRAGPWVGLSSILCRPIVIAGKAQRIPEGIGLRFVINGDGQRGQKSRPGDRIGPGRAVAASPMTRARPWQGISPPRHRIGRMVGLVRAHVPC